MAAPLLLCTLLSVMDIITGHRGRWQLRDPMADLFQDFRLCPRHVRSLTVPSSMHLPQATLQGWKCLHW